MNASSSNLQYLVSQLPAFSTWSAAGVGKSHSAVQEMASGMGGGIRTGLEDCLYLDLNKKVLAKNSDWIKKAVDQAIRNNREIATPDDVRYWLELK